MGNYLMRACVLLLVVSALNPIPVSGRDDVEPNERALPEMSDAQWQRCRSEQLTAISRSFALCSTIEDVQLSLEYYLVEDIEQTFKHRSAINRLFATEEVGLTATSLAGESLFYLGWKTSTSDEVIEKLVQRSRALGLGNEEIYSNPDFKKFAAKFVEHRNALLKETMASWRKTWGEKPKSWQGIFSAKRVGSKKSDD